MSRFSSLYVSLKIKLEKPSISPSIYPFSKCAHQGVRQKRFLFSSKKYSRGNRQKTKYKNKCYFLIFKISINKQTRKKIKIRAMSELKLIIQRVAGAGQGLGCRVTLGLNVREVPLLLAFELNLE